MPQIMDQTEPIPSDGEYYNLGVYRREITTSSPAAQTWFARGLIWCYGFNHEESVKCFEQAALHDPDCGMAYWGIAYALGPNYNKPWQSFDRREKPRAVARTHQMVELARRKTADCWPVERALIEALRFRYPGEKSKKGFNAWNREYANAMQGVYERFPDDLDVATLYADALMNLTPWSLWELKTGKPAGKARTLDVKTVLEYALSYEQGRQHPGILHAYIHLMEMSWTPELALPQADLLRGLCPDAGHLEHMPSHIYILCGHYQQAIASNTSAYNADDKFFQKDGAMNFYTLYRAHDLHFRLYGAMFAGQQTLALDTIDKMEAAIPEKLLRIESPPMADWLEAFHAMRYHALIRFGHWTTILNLPLPTDQKLYCVTTAMLHYSKGIALAILNRIPEALSERKLFLAAVKRVSPWRTLFSNKCLDILKVAAQMLDGEIEYRRKNFTKAFAHLRKSVELDDSLPYDEPWGWMQPTRHALGALLLEQGQIKEAAAVYRADLGLDKTLPRSLQHPNNVWALHGYHECLVRLGEGTEAEEVKGKLERAIKGSDTPIRSSCFCRLGSSGAGADGGVQETLKQRL